MSNTANVQAMTEDASRIFATANEIVEKMADGSRIQIKDLAAEVSAVVGLEPKRVLGFINYFVFKTDIAYVSRGKKGGLIKGQKPAKVAKPKRAKKTDVTE